MPIRDGRWESYEKRDWRRAEQDVAALELGAGRRLPPDKREALIAEIAAVIASKSPTR